MRNVPFVEVEKSKPQVGKYYLYQGGVLKYFVAAVVEVLGYEAHLVWVKLRYVLQSPTRMSDKPFLVKLECLYFQEDDNQAQYAFVHPFNKKMVISGEAALLFPGAYIRLPERLAVRISMVDYGQSRKGRIEVKVVVPTIEEYPIIMSNMVTVVPTDIVWNDFTSEKPGK